MTERLEGVIASFAQKLNFAWFRLKEKEFESNDNYDSDQKKIVIDNRQTIPTDSAIMYGLPGEQLPYVQEWVQVGTFEAFDFRRYCSAYLPLDSSTTWGFYPPPKSKLPSNYQKKNYSILELADELISKIAKQLSTNATAKETFDFVMLVNRIAQDEIRKLRDTSSHVIYNKVLDDFELKINELLHKKYENELFTSAISFQTDDKLEFHVGQEELASLLALLEKAKILKTGDKINDRRKFFEFCQRYLHFTKGKSTKNPKTANPTTVKTFRDKFGEAQKAINNKKKKHPPLENIIDKILSSIG